MMVGVKEAAAKALAGGAPEDSISSLDTMINRMQGLKRKLGSLHEDEQTLLEHSRKRIAHLQDLYNIPSLVDKAYDKWSRTRLDRLLVDFLLRAGYGETARQLAQGKKIEVGFELRFQTRRLRRGLTCSYGLRRI